MAEQKERRESGWWLRAAEVLYWVSSTTEEQVTLGLCAAQVTAVSQNKPADQKTPASSCRAGLKMLWLFPSCPGENKRHSHTPVTRALLL